MNSSSTIVNHSVETLTSEVALLQKENVGLASKVDQLQQQLDWFKRQLFGEKSEKRSLVDPAIQPSLLEGLAPVKAPIEPPSQTIAAHERTKKLRDGCTTDSGLRFDESVPVQVVDILPEELKGELADQYDVISHKVTFRLAQNRASYVVIEERRPVIKERSSKKLITTPVPDRVLDNSIADVSFLAGMLIDKFLYHLPLHRQHQRLTAAGITLSRSVLTQLCAKAVSLLKPIADAQCQHVLKSKVLAIDETPIKAGRKSPGKMKQGYFWPMYGEEGEIVFRYCNSRSGKHLESLLQGFQGTLLTDGYAAYDRYVANNEGVTHAQCWAHTRRGFEKALNIEPEAAGEALDIISTLYQYETAIREKQLTGKAKQDYRLKQSEPIVQAFWQWCEQQCLRHDLTPTNPLTKALKYAMERTEQLKVFLNDPDVAIDTNHLERGLRPIPMGKKNWLFCWTESGAEDVATIQSLLATCRIQEVNAYEYLVDVLQRVSTHPAKDVLELTPRIWKQRFSQSPLRSVVEKR
jgi:transposase